MPGITAHLHYIGPTTLTYTHYNIDPIYTYKQAQHDTDIAFWNITPSSTKNLIYTRLIKEQYIHTELVILKSKEDDNPYAKYISCDIRVVTHDWLQQQNDIHRMSNDPDKGNIRDIFAAKRSSAQVGSTTRHFNNQFGHGHITIYENTYVDIAWAPIVNTLADTFIVLNVTLVHPLTRKCYTLMADAVISYVTSSHKNKLRAQTISQALQQPAAPITRTIQKLRNLATIAHVMKRYDNIGQPMQIPIIFDITNHYIPVYLTRDDKFDLRSLFEIVYPTDHIQEAQTTIQAQIASQWQCIADCPNQNNLGGIEVKFISHRWIDVYWRPHYLQHIRQQFISVSLQSPPYTTVVANGYVVKVQVRLLNPNRDARNVQLSRLIAVDRRKSGIPTTVATTDNKHKLREFVEFLTRSAAVLCQDCTVKNSRHSRGCSYKQGLRLLRILLETV